jgi:hypothetical protein
LTGRFGVYPFGVPPYRRGLAGDTLNETSRTPETSTQSPRNSNAKQ